MPKRATKRPDNIFYKRRIEASKWDRDFVSRERTAERLYIDRTRLANIELEKVVPHPEETATFAEAYKAPELCNYYCSQLCPLGKETIPKIELNELDRTVLLLLAALKDLPKIKEELITIAADGDIQADERRGMDSILATLNEAAKRIQSLVLYCDKHRKITT